MDLDILRTFCAAKAGAEECFPFGESTLVYKVAGKMFVLADMDGHPLSFNIKATPAAILEQRERHAAVTPGYHQNKTHWNTVMADGSIPDATLLQWIDESYQMVVAGLPRSKRTLLLGDG